MMQRTVFRIVSTLAILASAFLSVPAQPASAATFRNHIARVPDIPTSAQSVRVWMQSDTAFGETAGLEYNIGSTYVKVLGTFDTSGPAPANWRADIPAQPKRHLCPIPALHPQSVRLGLRLYRVQLELHCQ
jgi:hypothetical protein